MSFEYLSKLVYGPPKPAAEDESIGPEAVKKLENRYGKNRSMEFYNRQMEADVKSKGRSNIRSGDYRQGFGVQNGYLEFLRSGETDRNQWDRNREELQGPDMNGDMRRMDHIKRELSPDMSGDTAGMNPDSGEIPALVKAKESMKFGGSEGSGAGYLQDLVYGQGGPGLLKSAFDSMVDLGVPTSGYDFVPGVGTTKKVGKGAGKAADNVIDFARFKTKKDNRKLGRDGYQDHLDEKNSKLDGYDIEGINDFNKEGGFLLSPEESLEKANRVSREMEAERMSRPFDKNTWGEPDYNDVRSQGVDTRYADDIEFIEGKFGRSLNEQEKKEFDRIYDEVSPYGDGAAIDFLDLYEPSERKLINQADDLENIRQSHPDLYERLQEAMEKQSGGGSDVSDIEEYMARQSHDRDVPLLNDPDEGITQADFDSMYDDMVSAHEVDVKQNWSAFPTIEAKLGRELSENERREILSEAQDIGMKNSVHLFLSNRGIDTVRPSFTSKSDKIQNALSKQRNKKAPELPGFDRFKTKKED